MEAARLQPRRASAWAELGTALGRSGKIAEAVGAFQRAVELEPQNAALLARLAFAEHAAGRIADAARNLGRSAALSGPSFTHGSALGVLLFDAGRPEEARRWLAARRPEDPDFAEARLRLALLEARGGDREKARRALREALAAAPALRVRAKSDAVLSGLLP
jgi:tetratricopeptide (TPR) repeat protein